MEKIKKDINLKIISLAMCTLFLTGIAYPSPDTASSLRPPVGVTYPEIKKELDRPAHRIAASQEKQHLEELVATGNYALAKEYIERCCLHPFTSKKGWSVAEDLAHALIKKRHVTTIDLRQFLDLLTPFIRPIIQHLHGDKPREVEARDALETIIWAFVEVGDKSDLQWMKNILAQLINEIEYSEVENIISGISEAIVKHGEAEDVGGYLDIFLKLRRKNLKEAEHAIYQMAVNIGRYGKPYHLAAFSDTDRIKKLNNFITVVHSREGVSYFDVLPAIGLAFLAKGNSAEYLEYYLGHVTDEEINIATRFIARQMVESKPFFDCINPYLVQFVPNLKTREARISAIENLAAFIAKDGSATHVKYYIDACNRQEGEIRKESRIIFIVLMRGCYRLEALEFFLEHINLNEKEKVDSAIIDGINAIIEKVKKLKALREEFRRIAEQKSLWHGL